MLLSPARKRNLKMFYDYFYSLTYDRRKRLHLQTIALQIRKCRSLAILIHVLPCFYYNEIFNNPVTHYFPHRFATSISLVKNITYFHLP